jgi:ribosomal protein S18 acetylase RimI-like enzyme
MMKKEEIKAKLIKATMADLSDFIQLEKEFMAYNDSIKENKHYRPLSSKKASRSFFKKELSKRISYPGELFFHFATIEKKPIGYIYGYIVNMPPIFKIGKVCYLDKMMVSKEFRGKGIGNLLTSNFLKWSRNKGAKLCQLNVSSVNKKTLSIYKKWGFKIDQYRLFKKL